ncbi:dihydropteroate synthase [Moraxella lincolnii]|uniref:dihydropteroate synthase n=1 Tax=Lwoffella lincolnii TaxID=90241 RepID=UPI0030D4AA8A
MPFSMHPLPNHTLCYRDKCLSLAKPQIMGILNVTPDSFSDGGEHDSVALAVKHAKQMMAQGASIIDIGGESTRPNADVVSTDQELERVVPVVQAIRNQLGDDVWLSIDTSNPKVMMASIEAGADIINDVRALKREGAVQVVADLAVPVVLMHMRGEPTTMNQLANYDDVLTDVLTELSQRVDAVTAQGVNRHNIIIDPGFGFAKHHQHHCQLLRQLQAFGCFDLPILFGVSRKRFLGEVLDNSGTPAFIGHTVKDRDPVGVAAALLAVQQGASIIRTHNVAMTCQALAIYEQVFLQQTPFNDGQQHDHTA